MNTKGTISIAAAAERLNTNSLLIERWIREGKITAFQTEQGVRVLEASFSDLYSHITSWLQENLEPDEDGCIRASIADMESFWKDQSR